MCRCTCSGYYCTPTLCLVDEEFLEACELPERYRRRPDTCFAIDEKEKSECNAAAVMASLFAVQAVSLALVPVLLARFG